MSGSFRFPDGVVDLSNCHKEPIQYPNAIQPHGVLLVLTEPDLTVLQLSANAEEHLGRPTDEILRRPIEDLLDQTSASLLRNVLTRDLTAANPLDMTLRDDPEGRSLDGIVHRTDGLVILELEPGRESNPIRFTDFYRQVRRATARLQSVDRLQTLCEAAAQEVRSLTGFDRVMVYRFDSEWNGEVVAEARTPTLPAWLGHRYPAADIPEQARRLYEINWLRSIPEVSYEPVPLVPERVLGSTGPLDMSQSTLRSVSPIHVEYLQNIEVGSSMSISLLVDGKLWGLIACHHRTPHFLPFEVRSSCEFLAQALSWQIGSRKEQDAALHEARARDHLARLMAQIPSQGDLQKALIRDRDALLGLVGAAGAAVCWGSNLETVGDTPSREQIGSILKWVAPLVSDGWFENDRLSLFFESAKEFRTVGSGILAIRISEPDESYILWFRPELVEEVRWGSPPRKNLEYKAGRPRLTPAGSRDVWEEVVRGRSSPWQVWEVQAARDLRQALLEVELRRAAELQQINEQLRRAGHAKDEFLATLSHELRNPLNAIVGWSRLLMKGKLPSDRRDHAVEVVYRNAEIQAQLIEDLLDVSRIVNGKLRLDVQPIELDRVIDDAIATVQSAADAKSIQIHKTLDTRMGPILGDADRLQQVIWNLLSNAIKFTPKRGRVRVTLQKNESSAEIHVVDNGRGIPKELLPTVFDRFQQGEGGVKEGGLGLGLSIVRGLVELHGGSVGAQSDGEGEGARFFVELPLAPVQTETVDTAGGNGDRLSDDGYGKSLRLDDLRILVIDDDPDSSDMVSQVLRDHGAEAVIVNAPRHALDAVRASPFDVILSDIGMPEMDGYELLREIRRLTNASSEVQIPAAALTAYARSQDRARAFRAGFQTHLAKPIDPVEMVTIVASLAGRLG